MSVIRVSADDARHPDAALKLLVPIRYPLSLDGEFLPSDSGGVAIVGTRNPSSYGVRMAQNAVSEALKLNKTVVSGLAKGIDSVAHRETLEKGGRTVAVLGSGIDTIYPAENRELAQQVAQNGVLLSQFPDGTAPLKKNFPIRNLTVVKLVDSVVVVEAHERSGSLITARLALEEGKRVIIIPGPLDSYTFAGNWAFYAKHQNNPLVTLAFSTAIFSTKNVRQATLFMQHPVASPQQKNETDISSVPEEHLSLFQMIHSHGNSISIDELSDKLSKSVVELSVGLLELEMAGVIKAVGSSYQSMM
ncbi:DNA-processing protein DprA [bacterium]|nr:DNA-processing protein DprA [bacterium]